MMHHLTNLLADKHAIEKTEWLTDNLDEHYNYTSNTGPTELKVTNEVEPRKNNIFYIGSCI